MSVQTLLRSHHARFAPPPCPHAPSLCSQVTHWDQKAEVRETYVPLTTDAITDHGTEEAERQSGASLLQRMKILLSPT